MAEKEKEILEGLAAFPQELRDEFLSQIQGAATAIKVLAPNSEETKEKGG